MLRLGMRASSIFNSQRTCRNRLAKRVQHVATTMLRSNVAVVWPELAKAGLTMLGYVALRFC